MTTLAYVGCRTTRDRNARGDGLAVFRIDPDSGDWTRVQLLEGLVNPSYLAFDRTGRFLYCVHGDAQQASAFAIAPGTGELRQLNTQDTGGRNPVHLHVDPTNLFVVVCNHLGSSLVALPRDPETGALGPRGELLVLKGEAGPHRIEQPYAKPHQVQLDPDGRTILVPDKGIDRVFVVRLDPETGRLGPADPPAAVAREGSGPRHGAFHPSGRFVYVVNELDSTVTAYRTAADGGAPVPFQLVPSLPDTFTGFSRAAGIVISADGRTLYASNRGHESIAVFAVDQDTGRIAPLQFVDTLGRTPRFFTPDDAGRFLFVANEDDDTIVRFAVAADGTLADPRIVARTGSPVCILFREVV